MSDEGLKLENDLCRCCQAEGRFKSLSESPRGEETFSEMLKIALDIELKPVSDPLDRKMYAICDTCIKRLEDADNFKQQVLGCERVFQQLYAGDLIKVVDKEEKIVITIKEESDSDDDSTKEDFMDSQLDEPDNPTDQMVLVEIPPIKGDEESEIRQSKSMLQTILIEPLKTERTKKPPPKQAAPAGKKRKPYKPRAKPKTLDEKIKIAMDRQEKEKEKKNKKKKTGQSADGESSQGFHLREIDYKDIDGKKKCARCSRVFVTNIGIWRHINAKHSETKSFKCTLCPERHETLKELVYHRLEKHNVDDRIQCNACDKAFVSKHGLKSHLDVYHKLGQSIKCEFCDYVCYSDGKKTNMRRHMVKHQAVKIYKCQYCSKSFPRLGALIFHERIHTGDRRKVCKECGQAFVQKASLNYHMAKHHPGVSF